MKITMATLLGVTQGVLMGNQTRASIQEQMPEIPDAGKIIEKLEKRVDELETWKAGAEKRIQDLMAWMIREGGGE
ncbi:MAG: hypothetical protein ACYTEW_27285 [Planctomycetota bacterium]|jgi:hypothetical protein